MKKTLTFIPLGIGISAAIIYIFNVIQFRVINNSSTLIQILANLKVYLYVSIAGFVCYFLIKILNAMTNKSKAIEVTDNKEIDNEIITDNAYEPFENIDSTKVNDKENLNATNNVYVPNYDYVPIYHEDSDIVNLNNIENINTISEEDEMISEPKEKLKKVIYGNSYCYNCGEKINDTDSYCSSCGAYQKNRKNKINPVLKSVIDVLEIVILILIIYFSLNMLFDYKESKDPNFTSPFKVSMTK